MREAYDSKKRMHTINNISNVASKAQRTLQLKLSVYKISTL